MSSGKSKRPVAKSVRFSSPTTGLPPLCPKDRPKPLVRKPFRIVDRPSSSEGESIEVVESPPPAAPVEQPAPSSTGEVNSLKRCLRPRKEKLQEPDVVITEVRPTSTRSASKKKLRLKTVGSKTAPKKKVGRKVAQVVIKTEKEVIELESSGEVYTQGGDRGTAIEIAD